jgi:predicted transcriptional regulator
MNPATSTKPAKKEGMKESTRKWGKIVLDAGFSIVPSVLFICQDELGLKPLQLNLLVQLLDFWWKKNRLPMPAKSTLAKRLGVSASTIRRNMVKLEEAGFIERVVRRDEARGQRSNHYDLKGLVEKLHPLAVRVNKERKIKREARKATASANGTEYGGNS